MWKSLRSLFAAKAAAPPRAAAGTGDRDRRAGHASSRDGDVRGETRAPVSGPEVGGAAPWSGPEPLPDVPSLDAEEGLEVILLDEEHDVELRIQRRIERGELSLSHLPSTSIAVMQLAAKPAASVTEVVKTLESDPVLSSELLKTANSILYGSRVPTQSIRDAVMRIGMRSLRTMILGLSMHTALLRTPNLKSYGEKVWRQAFTVASIARSVADRVGVPPERAFLLGLLHDIGKLAILDTLSKEIRDDASLTPSLVGRLFLRWHEVCGRKMAERWKLTDELISVAGNHHDFRGNEDFPLSAAFVSLCHKMELYLSLGAEREYRELENTDEFDVLAVAPDRRRPVLAQGLRTYLALHAGASDAGVGVGAGAGDEDEGEAGPDAAARSRRSA